MRGTWQSISGVVRTIFRVLVIFAIVRLVFGAIAIAFLSDDSLAYSLRASGILAAATLVALAVALVIRQFSFRRPKRS